MPCLNDGTAVETDHLSSMIVYGYLRRPVPLCFITKLPSNNETQIGKRRVLFPFYSINFAGTVLFAAAKRWGSKSNDKDENSIC